MAGPRSTSEKEPAPIWIGLKVPPLPVPGVATYRSSLFDTITTPYALAVAGPAGPTSLTAPMANVPASIGATVSSRSLELTLGTGASSPALEDGGAAGGGGLGLSFSQPKVASTSANPSHERMPPSATDPSAEPDIDNHFQ